MGITKGQFNSILSTIFTTGNKIELFSTMPNPSTETGYVKVSGTGYTPWTIRSGDFTVSSGSVQSAANMMFYLCESTGGHGTAKGFGVFNGTTLLYFGEFSNPMTIAYNSVPTIKKYNASAGEGIRITMTSTEAAATAE